MKPVILLAAAQQDVDERFEWYAEQAGLELAIRFYLAFDAAVRSLSERPGAGAPRGWRTSRLRGHRSWPVPGFGAVRIYHRERKERIEVSRVLHGAQDIDRVFEPVEAYAA